MPSDDPIRELGRSVAQLHIKVSRLQESFDALGSRESQVAGAGAGQHSELDNLLDLLDAVESALARRSEPRGLFGRRRNPEQDLWRGLAVAAAEAAEQLRRQGIEAAPEQGTFDPELHRAVEVVPLRPGREQGALASTHRRGWVQRRGNQRVVLRTAQVSVHGEGA